jgi:hypothetical protein
MNVKITQKYPKLDAHGFLERAFSWLNSGIDIGIFYAALELRFTFEKVLIKHGFASSNYTTSFEKMNWKPDKLHEALDKEFSQRINLSKSYRFFLETGNEPVVFGYYLPIDQELFSLYGKLDNYLHAQWAIPIGLPDNAWQKENSQLLRNFAERLIPHANPKNSLDYLSLPNIKFDELKIPDAEIMLKKYWRI